MKTNHKLGYKTSEQSGRSMVEMLSVVSIIGILTVAGFAGYSVLMEKHRENQLMQETTLRAVAVSSQLLAGKDDPTLAGFDKNVLGHDITVASAPYAFELQDGDTWDPSAPPVSGDEYFALELSDVSSSVCRFFVQFARDLGLVQEVVNASGKRLDEALCKDIDENSSSSTLRSGSSGGSTSSGSSSSGSTKIYLIYRSDMALEKKVEGIIEEPGKVFCSDHGSYYIHEGYPGCKCDAGWSGEKCSEQSELCSGHGSAYVNALGASACLCNPGYTGAHCEEMLAYSPCQTLAMENGQEVRGFKSANITGCTQAGIQGTCDGKGHCKLVGGKSCSDVSGCSDLGHDYFCNYGGHAGDYQGGGTPDVCQKVNAEEFSIGDATFYYNTDEDLRSWCRAADNRANCTWGFLSYQGAQSWCESLGARLVDADYIVANCAEFEKHLPRVYSEQAYWTATTNTLVSIGGNCKTGTTDRKDGYANNGGVVCVKGEIPLTRGGLPQGDLSNSVSNFDGKQCSFEGGYCHAQDGTYYTLLGCFGGILSQSDGCDSATDETCPGSWNFGPACNSITIYEETEEGCPEGDEKCECESNGGTWTVSGCCTSENPADCQCMEEGGIPAVNGQCCKDQTEKNWRGEDYVSKTKEQCACQAEGKSWYAEYGNIRNGSCCHYQDEKCQCESPYEGGKWVVGSVKDFCCYGGDNEKCQCEADGRYWHESSRTCCDTNDEQCNCFASGTSENPKEFFMKPTSWGEYGVCCDANDESCKCDARGEGYVYGGYGDGPMGCCHQDDVECTCKLNPESVYVNGQCCGKDYVDCVCAADGCSDIWSWIYEMRQVQDLLNGFTVDSSMTGARRELAELLVDLKEFATQVVMLGAEFQNPEVDGMGDRRSNALPNLLDLKKVYETKDYENRLNTLKDRVQREG